MERKTVAAQQSLQNVSASLRQLRQRLQELECRVKNYAVIIYAGDNGISEEGASRYEPLNSGSIVNTHLYKQAPTAFFLERIGSPEFIVDIGLHDCVSHPDLLEYKVASGTRNFLYEDAITAMEAEQALASGSRLWNRIGGSRFDIVGIGEIGIGDTLCAAAIASVLTGNHPELMTGPGSADDKVISQKTDIIVKAIAERCPAIDIIDLLSRFGGLEIAGLTGFILEATAHRVPIILDGYVTAVAALLASLADRRVGHYIIAPSLSQERGHKIVLDELGVNPLLSLDLNYGEGLVSAIGLFMAELSSSL